MQRTETTPNVLRSRARKERNSIIRQKQLNQEATARGITVRELKQIKWKEVEKIRATEIPLPPWVAEQRYWW